MTLALNITQTLTLALTSAAAAAAVQLEQKVVGHAQALEGQRAGGCGLPGHHGLQQPEQRPHLLCVCVCVCMG